MRYFGDDDYEDHWEEVERLRALNAELVRACEAFLACHIIKLGMGGWPSCQVDTAVAKARAAIAKAREK